MVRTADACKFDKIRLRLIAFRSLFSLCKSVAAAIVAIRGRCHPVPPYTVKGIRLITGGEPRGLSAHAHRPYPSYTVVHRHRREDLDRDLAPLRVECMRARGRGCCYYDTRCAWSNFCPLFLPITILLRATLLPCHYDRPDGRHSGR